MTPTPTASIADVGVGGAAHLAGAIERQRALVEQADGQHQPQRLAQLLGSVSGRRICAFRVSVVMVAMAQTADWRGRRTPPATRGAIASMALLALVEHARRGHEAVHHARRTREYVTGTPAARNLSA